MKKSIFLIIALSLIITACIHKNSNVVKSHYEKKELYGNWHFEIDDANSSGSEIISFNPESVIVIDSIIYKGSEQGFDFSIPIYTKVKGNWKLSNDSIILSYEKKTMEVKADVSKFKATLNKPNGNIEAFQNIKDSLAIDLANSVENTIKNRFNQNDLSQIYWGSLVRVVPDTAIIRRDDKIVFITKYQ